MRFALDHVVIAVSDLERAIADYRKLGFTVTPGGRHPGRTSHNALIVFADGAYIELIAWTAPNDAERWNVMHREHGDGFMDFALIPEDLPRATAEAKARGLPLNGPIDGSRVRPDGVELRWQTTRQETFDLPFFCADVTPRALRVPEGEVRRHENGATGIEKLVVAANDPRVSVERYRQLLGAEPSADASYAIGETTVALVQRANRRREGPCAMTIRTTGKPFELT